MRDPTTREADRIRAYYSHAAWPASAGRNFLVAERRAALVALLREHGTDLRNITICDVGSGSGGDLLHWRSVGVAPQQLFGTELTPELAQAASTAVPGASIARAAGFSIPFANESFDVVTLSLVLSSIRRSTERRALLAEARRVTRRGGLTAIYDFRIRKPWNREVVGIMPAEVRTALIDAVSEQRLAPFLPALELLLRLPPSVSSALIRWLPRTHRLWVCERRT